LLANLPPKHAFVRAQPDQASSLAGLDRRNAMERFAPSCGQSATRLFLKKVSNVSQLDLLLFLLHYFPFPTYKVMSTARHSFWAIAPNGSTVLNTRDCFPALGTDESIRTDLKQRR